MRLVTFAAILAASIVCLPILAAGNVVTFDVPSKKVDSSSPDLESTMIQVEADQAGVLIQSNLYTPQEFTLTYMGISPQDYDIYINGEYKGVRTIAELTEGIKLTTPGTIISPGQFRCLKALKPKVAPEEARLSGSKKSEELRVHYTMLLAVQSVASGIRQEKAYRSVDVVVGPAGKVLRRMMWPTRQDAEGTCRTATRACWLLQQYRSRMSKVIVDDELRNRTMAALTPVTLTAKYYARDGERFVDVSILNECDLDMSGSFNVKLPAGWKCEGNAKSFSGVKSGSAHVATCRIVPKSKIAWPEKLAVSAEVEFFLKPYRSKTQLTTTAEFAK